jgi:hypothetical protein
VALLDLDLFLHSAFDLLLDAEYLDLLVEDDRIASRRARTSTARGARFSAIVSWRWATTMSARCPASSNSDHHHDLDRDLAVG